eukprot:EC716997.1.p3 GENE.EC716997.1~~EC716997.1.p3  ORF type:complete len:84 (-),score=4.78 EC716997.1:535-786(-)
MTCTTHTRVHTHGVPPCGHTFTPKHNSNNNQELQNNNIYIYIYIYIYTTQQQRRQPNANKHPIQGINNKEHARAHILKVWGSM